MPPHCDSLDGPVVGAARQALSREDVELLLPFAPAGAEEELRAAFELVSKARTQGPEAQDVADRFLFETAVRLHRAGEGAPYDGLKPAGLDVGPVIPLAEEALEDGSLSRVLDFLIEELQTEMVARYEQVLEARGLSRDGDLDSARHYVSLMLGFQVWAHSLYRALKARHHEPHVH